MADDLDKRESRDRARINVHEDWERRCIAVSAVGVTAKDVARHLGAKAD